MSRWWMYWEEWPEIADGDTFVKTLNNTLDILRISNCVVSHISIHSTKHQKLYYFQINGYWYHVVLKYSSNYIPMKLVSSLKYVGVVPKPRVTYNIENNPKDIFKD
jgi:hypothetical protein